jgi:hypothetical protein
MDKKEIKTLHDILNLEKDLTNMFDSDTKIALAILEEIRKLDKDNIKENCNPNVKCSEIFYLIKNAYEYGYNSYDMIEAGLEPYNPDDYARFVLMGIC